MRLILPSAAASSTARANKDSALLEEGRRDTQSNVYNPPPDSLHSAAPAPPEGPRGRRQRHRCRRNALPRKVCHRQRGQSTSGSRPVNQILRSELRRRAREARGQHGSRRKGQRPVSDHPMDGPGPLLAALLAVMMVVMNSGSWRVFFSRSAKGRLPVTRRTRGASENNARPPSHGPRCVWDEDAELAAS